MKQIIDIKEIASRDASYEESAACLKETIMTMAEQFWETLYDCIYDTEPLYGLYDTMEHLNDTGCSEEAFDVLSVMYLSIDDIVMPSRSIRSDHDIVKYFMTEFIAVSANIIAELDRAFKYSLTGYIRRKEEKSWKSVK